MQRRPKTHQGTTLPHPPGRRRIGRRRLLSGLRRRPGLVYRPESSPERTQPARRGHDYAGAVIRGRFRAVVAGREPDAPGAPTGEASTTSPTA